MLCKFKISTKTGCLVIIMSNQTCFDGTVDALPNCLPKASIKGENDSFCAVFGRHSASSPNLAPNPARVDLENVFIRS